MDGEDLVKSVKADSIKKYYASRSIKKGSAMNSLCKEPFFHKTYDLIAFKIFYLKELF